MPDSSQTATAAPDGNTVACVECDLLVNIPTLGMRQRSICPRCGEVLSHGNVQRARLALPYGICAALLLPLSLLFPFLSFARSGVSNQINLIQSAWALYLDGSVVLSGIVFTFIPAFAKSTSALSSSKRPSPSPALSPDLRESFRSF